MAKALSVDLRQRVVAAIDGGLSCRQAAERFGVSAASAIRWRGRLKEAGGIAPRQQGGDRKSQRIEAHSQLILDAVTAKPDITLAELRDLFEIAVEYRPASLHFGASSSAGRSRLKKDSARRRATARRYKCCARGLVRRANRS